jgi:ketosteroid isomerase-like protein
MARAQRRRFPFGLALAGALALVLALGGAGGVARAQADPVAVFRQVVDARNRGDLDGTMAPFADDAVRMDGSCVPPCVGAAAIRRTMADNIAEHFQATVLGAQAQGDTVTARAELRSDGFRAGGAERVLCNFTVELRAGQIVRWSSVLDSGDAQTAAFVAWRAAQQAQAAQAAPGTQAAPGAPAPLPAPGGVPLRLPQTGARGESSRLLVAAAVLAVFGGARLRRRPSGAPTGKPAPGA